MVDWDLARRIARLAAGSAASSAGPGALAGLPAMTAAAEQEVRRFTGLEPAEPIPDPEALDRRAWAEVNIAMLASLLDPVGDRLGGRLGAAGPFGDPLRAVAGWAVAAEAGLVTGYLAQRILGQYELSLLEPEAPPRLLFVAPNLAEAIQEMAVDRDSFLTWITLHEVTHALQFSGVPWLRAHLGGLLREYLASVEVRIERAGQAWAARLPSLPDAARIVEAFREGGLVALVHTPEQREIIDRIQAAMAVVEGYSEHVMDAVGAEVIPAYAGLREALERRRRSRSAPERILQRLLGFDLKLRQYELGKRFCDAVAGEIGIGGLNRVWAAPGALPTAGELERPRQWISRLERERELSAEPS
ncbi:MAG: zinc-dependent metalloprotease [Actinomycetota bacterium]|nr:zinc-dependent metalloprotease [Actinomycetota bacterium]